MARLAWKPWHEVVTLRDDLRNGELALSIFAADLYDVVMERARPVYQQPREFFSFTYPTYNLRELAKDVVLRLAGRNDKAVRQLELTYGGGKTHTLITLFHLVQNPQSLPDLPAVQEFIQHIGMQPPRARIAVLAFDKLDAEKGMEIRGPSGETRWLKHPWSVLAFQIAGADGLRLLHPEGEEAERESAPAENLLVELLSLPGKQGLATLILIDEVLMYVREKVGLDPVWHSRLLNFFQYLTQATTKVDNCAIVASLLATDPRKSDTLGKELTHDLYAIFRRENEGGVQPVLKEDVAEVLRRRFFTPASVRDRAAFRPHVSAALQGIAILDEQTSKDRKGAEERFFDSYPFHPDLTEIFYTKWTNLESFQRTRGVLRTFALALRAAEAWDNSPLIATNVFLDTPEKNALSASARELTNVAETEEYEGKKQEWTGILEGELGKARQIQAEFPGLRFREVEQAVFATFLHSQPIGKDARTRELLALLGHTYPDKIELEKALQRWTEISWFLDEKAMQDVETTAAGTKQLPKSWRLGSRPNLRQMHHEACLRVLPEFIEDRLVTEIGNCKSLSSGASAAGARVHTLPEKPKDVEDDGAFRYVILGPKAASRPGFPSQEARRFIDEHTGPDRPRVNRNAIVLAVPSLDGLEAARVAIRDYRGWLEVESQLKEQELDAERQQLLKMEKDRAAKRIVELVRQAYCIVVTVSEKNTVQAFKVVVGNEPLFSVIKADSQARIRETPVTAAALLPEGPFDLWREGEQARRVDYLVGAFAASAHLPKMLKREAILDTLMDGCREGLFVLRLARPDQSLRTFWRELPDDVARKDPALEVVLPQYAKLASLAPSLLLPGVLPDLWQGQELKLSDLYAYFSSRVLKDEYGQDMFLPRASQEVVDAAVQSAVRERRLWLLSGPASFLGEDLPAGVLTADATVQAPPQPIAVKDLLPQNLPEAWGQDGTTTTALAISDALSTKSGAMLPWLPVREAIDGALRSRLLERADDSAAWPCDYASARFVKISVIGAKPPTPPPAPPVVQSPPPVYAPPAQPGRFAAEAALSVNELQDLTDQLAELTKAAAGFGLEFRLRIELGSKAQPTQELVDKLNQLLEEVSKDLQLH